ncbi:transglycosylase SLT domain-containing protein [Nitrococcus mobilis]|uniref:Soluble lytic murein transglycosylase n=1 Tax=Nitrococcus mobilis Nb-231 TaxID=314278 RepID=A4BTF2_9GAMM|nr:transglycosylase SLT domain-containing protein [Nitrococcus mobilis]EAR21054.1 soluble lytic murein transglycosylase precursor [Nitrococcus mobilis Nb-231]
MHWRRQSNVRAVLRASLLTVLAFLVSMGITEAKERGATTPLSLYEAALRNLEANQLQRFRELAGQLEAFPLYPYLRYAELRHQIESVTTAAVEAYLEHYSDLPVTPRLRIAWLRELARREDWATFLASYRGERNVYLRCAQVQAELAMGHKAQAIAAAKPLWPVGYRQPQSCNPAFDLLAQSGVLTPERVENRILLALQAGHSRLAAELLERLPAAGRDKVAHWLEVYHHPETALQNPPLGSDAVVSQLLTAALGHLARADPAQAHRLWSKIKARYSWPETLTGPVERNIALRAAYHGLPSANGWLQALPETQADARVHAWRVRSALRAGEWGAVARAVKEMPAAQSNATVWRYWQARAMEKLGQRERAKRLYRTIAKQFSYYGFLAADALGTPYRWGAAIPPPEPLRKRTLHRRAALQRALLLHQAEQHELAHLEWRTFIRRLKGRDRLAAARIAEEQNWPWATLYAAVTAGVNNASLLRFPMGYLSAVRRSAQASGIDPAWLLALIRQESAFRGSACSHAGACGVMQLMPATARWVLKRNGQDSADLSTTISDPANSIAVGADYLAYLRGRFSSHILALAAYNAGPGNVANWVNVAEPPVGSARWIETLLYGETRRYLKAVVFNNVIYRLRLNDQTMRVDQLLQEERTQRAQAGIENLAGE